MKKQFCLTSYYLYDCFRFKVDNICPGKVHEKLRLYCVLEMQLILFTKPDQQFLWSVFNNQYGLNLRFQSHLPAPFQAEQGRN